VAWRLSARTVLCGVLLCGMVAGVLSGCTPVPSQVARPSAVPPGSPSRSPSPLPSDEAPPPGAEPLPTTVAASATGFAEAYAVNCAGRPGVDGVVALLRAKGVITGSPAVTPQVGPLCAGTWQYTVLGVAGRESLQVVTEGPPEALHLVAAGTDVCSGAVRTLAPTGIISVAHCG
jgi:hypothetical protein